MYEFKIITSLVILDEQKRFLLGKRSMKEDVFPGLWSIPGGKVESPLPIHDVLEKNVKKEVLEEFGVEVEVTGYVQSHSNGENKVYVIFLGKIVKGKPRPLEDTDEVRWFRFEELEKNKLCPEVYDILKKVSRGFQ
jgi:ADP-ribose pyrophosphatase YjhB (NUDIX family)